MGNSETFGKVLCLYVVAENAARLASQEGAEKYVDIGLNSL